MVSPLRWKQDTRLSLPTCPLTLTTQARTPGNRNPLAWNLLQVRYGDHENRTCKGTPP